MSIRNLNSQRVYTILRNFAWSIWLSWSQHQNCCCEPFLCAGFMVDTRITGTYHLLGITSSFHVCCCCLCINDWSSTLWNTLSVFRVNFRVISWLLQGYYICNFTRSEVAEDLADDGAALTWQDKVKVMRSRAHVNSLQTEVKDKQYIVDRCRFVSKKQSRLWCYITESV